MTAHRRRRPRLPRRLYRHGLFRPGRGGAHLRRGQPGVRLPGQPALFRLPGTGGGADGPPGAHLLLKPSRGRLLPFYSSTAVSLYEIYTIHISIEVSGKSGVRGIPPPRPPPVSPHSAQRDGYRLVLQNADGIVWLPDPELLRPGQLRRIGVRVGERHRPHPSLPVIGAVQIVSPSSSSSPPPSRRPTSVPKPPYSYWSSSSPVWNRLPPALPRCPERSEYNRSPRNRR